MSSPTSLPTTIVPNVTTGHDVDSAIVNAAVNALTAAAAAAKSASDLTTGTLPAARIADASITEAKLAFAVATQAELDAVAAATGGTDASALTSGTLPAARVADGSLPLTKLATPVAPKTETDAIKVTADAALAASGGSTPVRVATASTTAGLADRGGIIHMRNTTTATVGLPLTATTAYPAAGATIVGVDRLGSGDVTFAKTVTGTSLQKFIAPYGVQAMLVGSTMTAELCRPPDAARPTTGLRALIVGDQFSAAADGTTITTVVPDASGSVTLPSITPAGTQQPTVHRNAAKGHTGIRFNGTTNVLPLTGTAWLDLMRNRPNAMVFAVVLVTGTTPTGHRTVVNFSTSASPGTSSRVLLKWRDSVTGASATGGRRLDADAAVATAGGVTAASPDLSVLAGRFVWSSSDLYTLRNGATVASNTTFQTDGSTSDTGSFAAAIGANSPGTAEFFQGTILEVAIYDDSVSVAAAYEAFAEQQYGEEWLISADGPAA